MMTRSSPDATYSETATLTVKAPGTYTGTYGTLTLNGNGTYSYTANANQLTAGQVVTDGASGTRSRLTRERNSARVSTARASDAASEGNAKASSRKMGFMPFISAALNGIASGFLSFVGVVRWP